MEGEGQHALAMGSTRTCEQDRVRRGVRGCEPAEEQSPMSVDGSGGRVL